MKLSSQVTQLHQTRVLSSFSITFHDDSAKRATERCTDATIFNRRQLWAFLWPFLMTGQDEPKYGAPKQQIRWHRSEARRNRQKPCPTWERKAHISKRQNWTKILVTCIWAGFDYDVCQVAKSETDQAPDYGHSYNYHLQYCPSLTAHIYDRILMAVPVPLISMAECQQVDRATRTWPTKMWGSVRNWNSQVMGKVCITLKSIIQSTVALKFNSQNFVKLNTILYGWWISRIKHWVV